jgi:hypothetical protein
VPPLPSTLERLDVLPVTIPQFPFPPGTVLFPNHTFIYQYHKSIVSHWNLSSYIRLSHEVLAADWHGDKVSGHWQLTTLDHTNNRTAHARFDHLIVATGHNHYPNEPRFQGQRGMGSLGAWSKDTPLYLLSRTRCVPWSQHPCRRWWYKRTGHSTTGGWIRQFGMHHSLSPIPAARALQSSADQQPPFFPLLDIRFYKE